MRDRNRAAEGAFQHYVVLMRRMVTSLPDDVAFEQTAVLPFTLSSAAIGLFQQDLFGLAMPAPTPSIGTKWSSCRAAQPVRSRADRPCRSHRELPAAEGSRRPSQRP